MIWEHWEVVDLDPHTWRNLGTLFNPQNFLSRARPGERVLSILHEDGEVLKVYDSALGVRHDLDLETIEDAPRVAKELYEAEKGLAEVQIFDKKSLIAFADRAQRGFRPDWDLDEHYHFVYGLAEDDPQGICYYPPHPPHWNHFTYEEVRHFIKEVVPSPSTLVLAVFDRDQLYISLILGIRDHKIKLVSTFDALVPLGLESRIGMGDRQRILKLVEERFDIPSFSFFAQRSAFEAWLTAADKQKALQQAVAEGTALLEPADILFG